MIFIASMLIGKTRELHIYLFRLGIVIGVIGIIINIIEIFKMR